MTGDVVEMDVAHQALQTEQREKVDHVADPRVEYSRRLGIVQPPLGRVDEALRFLASDHVSRFCGELDERRRKPVFLSIGRGAHYMYDRDDDAVHGHERRALWSWPYFADPKDVRDVHHAP